MSDYDYTEKQGQYLAFIYNYTLINGRPPAEADMQRYFWRKPSHCSPDGDQVGSAGVHQQRTGEEPHDQGIGTA
jgi:hypothetical protein